MTYIGRTFKKIGERINRLFQKHEPVQDYRIEEPGYVPIVKTKRLDTKSRDTGTDLPGFDPKAGKYRVRIGYKRKPASGSYGTRLTSKKARKKKQREEEEYREPHIIQLREEEEKKKKAA